MTRTPAQIRRELVSLYVDADKYFAALASFFRHIISRHQLESIVLSTLGKIGIPLHNEYILSIISAASKAGKRKFNDNFNYTSQTITVDDYLPSIDELVSKLSSSSSQPTTQQRPSLRLRTLKEQIENSDFENKLPPEAFQSFIAQNHPTQANNFVSSFSQLTNLCTVHKQLPNPTELRLRLQRICLYFGIDEIDDSCVSMMQNAIYYRLKNLMTDAIESNISNHSEISRGDLLDSWKIEPYLLGENLEAAMIAIPDRQPFSASSSSNNNSMFKRPKISRDPSENSTNSIPLS